MPLVLVSFTNALFFSGIVYFVIALWTFQQWHNKASRTFTLLLVSAGFYSLGYYFEIASNDLEELLLWLKIKYIGLPFIPFLWLVFVIQFTDRSRYIKKNLWPVFFVVPLVTLLLVLWGPSSSFFYSSIEFRKVNELAIPHITPGPWAIVHFIFTNISIFSGIIILANSGLKANKYLRKRYYLFLAGVIPPWICSMVFLLGLTPGRPDLTPFALIFTAFIIIIELSELKLFDILPLARTRIFDEINTGIIVVDKNNLIADINPWTQKNLGLNETHIGTDIYSIISNENQMLDDLFRGGQDLMELNWKNQQQQQMVFELCQRPLKNRTGKLLGRLITINDITLRKQNQEDLSNERILLRTLVDNIPMSVYVKDHAGKKLLANATDLSYMGLTEESQALGKTDFDFFPPEQAMIFSADDRMVLQTGNPIMDKEEYLEKRNGEKFWLMTSKVPFRDKDGKILGVLGIGRDITEKKKMQQDLAESEARFRILTETTSAAVFIFHGKKYIYLNPASEKLTGYTLHEMKNMNFWDIVHPQHKEIVRNRGMNRLFGKNEAKNYEFKIITKDGKEKWVNYSTGVSNYGGKLVAIGTSFDITERKIAEEALSRSEQRYRKIFENSNTGIIQLTTDSEIVNANNAMAHILGFTDADHLLEDRESVVNCLFANLELKKEFFSKISDNDYISNFELEAIRLDGKKRLITVNAWKNKGSCFIEGFFLDITDRRLSLQYQYEVAVARKSSEAKNQFLANMSHEIRTPVTGILGMTEILSHTNLNEQQQDYLETIKDSSVKLLDLINEILDISKIEAGKIELRSQVFDLQEMLKGLKSMFLPIAEKRNIKLEFKLPSRLPLSIKGDRKRIEQILMNLITNALKFTREGIVLVNTSTLKSAKGNFFVKFEVKDSGIGIKPEDVGRLFKKFSQLDNSLARISEGTGLGLFICRELVKLMNGKIKVKSKYGKGSTFWFSIPVEEIKPEFEKELIKAEQKEVILSGLNLLVVDDKLVNRKVLKLMLESEGCNIDLASDGYEALEIFDPDKHQLIFMDIMMPGMDGITAMKAIKKTCKTPPPIIALTANAMEGDAQAYLKNGFDDYLSKPVTKSDLQSMIQKWVPVEGIA